MDIMNTLLEISVYSAVICIAVMLVKKLFGSKMSPLLHYAIWALLIVRLMMPLTIDSGFRLFTIPDTQPQTQTASIMSPQSFGDSAVWQMSDGNSGTAAVPAPSAVSTTVGDTPDSISPASVDTTKTAEPWSTANILIAVWAAGAAAVLVYIAVSYVVFRRRIYRGMVPVPERVSELFDQCRQEMGIRRPVRISAIYGLGTPALFLPTIVLLPVEFIAVADDSKLELAMRHELTLLQAWGPYSVHVDAAFTGGILV